MRNLLCQWLRGLGNRYTLSDCFFPRSMPLHPAAGCSLSHHLPQSHPSPKAATSHRHFSTTVTALGTQNLVSPDSIVQSPLPDLDIPTNLPFHELIFQKCDEFKDLIAVEDFLTGRGYTYGQLKEKAIRVASGLHKLGYRKGDVITVFSTNTIDVTVLMLAASATGLWVSSANSTFTPEELSRQLNHSDSITVFTAPAMAGVVKDALTNQQFPNKVKKIFVFGESPGCQPFQMLLDDDGKSYPDVDLNPMEDVYAMPYSSGTTGLPKGVMLTHYNLVANCMQTFAIKTTSASTEDHCLGLLPLYHIYGMAVVQFSIMLGGASAYFLPKFEPETFLRCIQDKKITLGHLVPPLIVFLAKHPMVSNYNITSLKRVVCGAAPLGEQLTREFLHRHNDGMTLNQGFGLTETAPVTNIDTTQTPGSIGHMVPNTLGKIVDINTNQVLGSGEDGEFVVKGPQVMKGYYKNQAATDEMIEPDGWLHTGDIGYQKDGMIYIHDRLKELIKYKGNQVAPAELEALLLGHPEINDAAVIGFPDEEAGELPRAFVVKKPNSAITEIEIIKFVEDRVAHVKRLRGGVEFIDEVPKNPSGKILRRVLRARFL